MPFYFAGISVFSYSCNLRVYLVKQNISMSLGIQYIFKHRAVVVDIYR